MSNPSAKEEELTGPIHRRRKSFIQEEFSRRNTQSSAQSTRDTNKSPEDLIKVIKDFDPEGMIENHIYIDNSHFYPISLIDRKLKEEFEHCKLLRFFYNLPTRRGRVYITNINDTTILNIDLSNGLDLKISEIFAIFNNEIVRESPNTFSARQSIHYTDLYYHLSRLIWV